MKKNLPGQRLANEAWTYAISAKVERVKQVFEGFRRYGGFSEEDFSRIPQTYVHKVSPGRKEGTEPLEGSNPIVIPLKGGDSWVKVGRSSPKDEQPYGSYLVFQFRGPDSRGNLITYEPVVFNPSPSTGRIPLEVVGKKTRCSRVWATDEDLEDLEGFLATRFDPQKDIDFEEMGTPSEVQMLVLKGFGVKIPEEKQ